MGGPAKQTGLVGMKMKCGSLVAAVIGFSLTACSQEAAVPEETAFDASAQQQSASTLAYPDLTLSVLPSTELIIERVESLMVTRPDEQTDSVIILASGLVPSRGWSRPRLVPADPDETTDAVNFHFVATSPAREMPESDPQPIEAQLEMPAFPSEVKMVRIISTTNELTTILDN